MRFIKKYYFLILIGIMLIAIVSIAANVYQYQTNQKLTWENTSLFLERDTLRVEIASSSQALWSATTTIALLEEVVADLEEDRDDLQDNLRDEKNKNDDFEDQIKNIAGTVGVLDKLSKTDKELLQKYSKVYFLNEHYIPESLRQLDEKYTYDENKPAFLHSKVVPYFEDMVKAANKDGVELWIVSAYRSFDMQAQLKDAYSITYGTGANTFSADQGYSEHQLGTTVDLTTTGINGGLAGFENTEAYAWRFVGTDLAKDLHRNDAHFYDWEQRKIDEYLISIFD